MSKQKIRHGKNRAVPLKEKASLRLIFTSYFYIYS